MLNLSKYTYEDSDLLRRTDRTFDAAWGRLMRAPLGALLPYLDDFTGEVISVPHALTLTYTGKSLTGVRIDRLPPGKGWGWMSDAGSAVIIRPTQDESFERQEVRALVYRRHILNCVERAHGARPLFLADDQELLAIVDPDVDVGDYQNPLMTGAVIRSIVMRQLATKEVRAREGESNHVKMERLRQQREAA